MIRTRERIEIVDQIKHDLIDEIIYDMTNDRDYHGITQKRLMKVTGLAQSDVSAILNRQTKRFTLDRLVMVLICLGHKPRIGVC